MYTSSKISCLLKQAENQGKILQVSSNGNQYLAHYCHDSKQIRTDSGMIDLASIQGHSFVDSQTDRTDSDDSVTTAYDDLTLLGGFVGQAHYRTDFSDSEKHRQDLAAAISGNTKDRKSFRERRDSQAKNQSSAVVTLPPITLNESQKQQVKQMIESGEDGKAIQSQFGRIDQQDLRQICDEIGLDPLDRILRFLA